MNVKSNFLYFWNYEYSPNCYEKMIHSGCVENSWPCSVESCFIRCLCQTVIFTLHVQTNEIKRLILRAPAALTDGPVDRDMWSLVPLFPSVFPKLCVYSAVKWISNICGAETELWNNRNLKLCDGFDGEVWDDLML